MAFFYNSNIYTNPRTPAHVRSTLDQLRKLDQGLADIVAQLQSDMAELQAQVGPVEATFTSAAVPGQPVYAVSSTNVDLADADSLSTAHAVGISISTVSGGGEGFYVTAGHVDLASWVAVTGSANLTPGAKYYVSDTTGMLTTTAPTADGKVVVEVGTALTDRVLDVNIQKSILL